MLLRSSKAAAMCGSPWFLTVRGVGVLMAPFVMILVTALQHLAATQDSFTFSGFQGFSSSADVVTLSGSATAVAPFGYLKLTTGGKNEVGRAFYNVPFRFNPKGHANGGDVLSFSTNFVFRIECPEDQLKCGHGFTFALSPTSNLTSSMAGGYLGLFSSSNDGNVSNRVAAVEFDTHRNKEFGDQSDDHIGIDINSVRSKYAAPAAYMVGQKLYNISLKVDDPVHAWVEYNGTQKRMTVAIIPGVSSQAQSILLSEYVDLSSIIGDEAFVGFTSSTGLTCTASHYIMGWSFALNGKAERIYFPRLPDHRPSKGQNDVTIPPESTHSAKPPFMAVVLLSSTAALLLLMMALGLLSFFLVKRRRRYAEVLEDWEVELGPHSRFTYKDLYKATGGFKEDNFLGAGGFGKVYHGVLSACGTKVAVKRVSHHTRQGVKEFVAEIVSMRQLRHRNLVQLLGYCRRKGELLLVYEFMSKGSLDLHLYNNSRSDARGKPQTILSWTQRFDIIKGVASALLYLHEGGERVVIHRDIKAGNVLLDDEWNGKLGDFGLSKLYDRGDNPQTTHVVGTLGYLAPELSTTGKATTSTDVYAYGAFLLEVVCGRRPIEVGVLEMGQDPMLKDWVLSNWSNGDILSSVDKKLGGEYVVEEVELVLQLGLLCSQLDYSIRPNMRQVMQFLEGGTPVTMLSPSKLNIASAVLTPGNKGFSDIIFSSLSATTITSKISSANIGDSLPSPQKNSLAFNESIL